MNPFSFTASYDARLSEIISKISKYPEQNPYLLELRDHLPAADLPGDLPIIKKTLLRLFEKSDLQSTVNEIIYKILKRVSVDDMQDIRVKWMLCNIDSSDKHSIKIRSKYFKLGEFEDEFYESIDWNKSGDNALKCFLYLLKNSAKQYTILGEDLKITSVAECKKLVQIIEFIFGRMCKELHAGNLNDCDTVPKYREIISRTVILDQFPVFVNLYEKIKNILLNATQPSIINEKLYILAKYYEILCKNFYNECWRLHDDNFKYICRLKQFYDEIGDQIELDMLRFTANSENKLNFLLSHAERCERPEILLNNIKPTINILKLSCIFADESLKELMKVNKHIFSECVNTSIKEFAMCAKRSGAEHAEKVYSFSLHENRFLLEIATGKYKIMLASLLKTNLSSAEFMKKDIEEVFENSVDVFSYEFLTTNSFGCSCLPLLKKYKISNFENMLFFYPNTEPEAIFQYCDDTAFLIEEINKYGNNTLLNIYASIKNSISRETQIIFYARLYEKVEAPELDCSFIFKNLMNTEFILYMLAKDTSFRKEFYETAVAYIKEMDVANSSYFTGYNFDTETCMHHDLKTPVSYPKINKLSKIYSLLKERKGGISANEKILVLIFKILQHNEIQLSNDEKELLRSISDGDICQRVASVTLSNMQTTVDMDLGRNTMLLRRLSEQAHERIPEIVLDRFPKDSLKINDIIVRYFIVHYTLIMQTDATFYSPGGLCAVTALVKSKNETTSPCVEGFINMEKTESCGFDYHRAILSFIDSDRILDLSDFRQGRLLCYEEMLALVSEEVASRIINTYSFAKLDSSCDDLAALEMCLSSILDTKNIFWLVLARALHLIFNMQISLFIDETLIKIFEAKNARRMDALAASFASYMQKCTDDELSLLGFSLPLLFKKYSSNRKIDAEKHIKAVAEQKIDGCKTYFSKTPAFYCLKFAATLDSIPYDATIQVPHNYPLAPPKLVFDYKKHKCSRFYMGIANTLAKTSKFADIFVQIKNNLEGKLDGHKECNICYYVLEPKYQTFPDFECMVCRNKYHKKCIYEWVKTSKNALCPLCRSEMNVWDLK
ncbi:hypothetical protein ENBRE01_1607 [Enteropsectra breve]|nr:hypothetical protein ENBRE01_1607 [Enteropsectra breve]